MKFRATDNDLDMAEFRAYAFTEMKPPRRTRQPGKTEWMAARCRDIALADQRLGTLENRCRWILDDFAARDPNTLSTSERALWRDNLMALALGPRPGGNWRWITVHEDDPLDVELRSLWQRVVALTRAHRESVNLPPLAGWLGRAPADAATSSVARTPYVRMGRGYRADDFAAALLHAVADVLIGCERLRECPECGQLFVAVRRQERHPRCARMARDARRPSRQLKKAG
jgi:hypothetical protein